MKELYIISGVAGMTGSELAKILVTEGCKVIGFDNFFASSRENLKEIPDNGLFDFYEYDLNSVEQMEQIGKMVKEIKAEYERTVYVNCAAVVHTEHFYHIDRTFTTNVTGMRDFLEQAIAVEADTYINCSTSEVYSMQSWAEGGVSEEDYILLANAQHSQRTSYAVGKLLTEFFMRDAVINHRIKGCSIRFANVYSKNELYPKHIIPHILTELSKNGEVELLENSRKNKRTFLHNTDSCMAVLALIRTEEALDGSIYNVATDEEISIIDLVNLCAEKLGIREPKIIFKGYRESDPERRVLNIDKIVARTGWKPKVSLAEGIEMCVGEMEKNRA